MYAFAQPARRRYVNTLTAERPFRGPTGGLGAFNFLGSTPKQTLTPFKGPQDTLNEMAKHALGPYGEQSVLVRQFCEFVIRDVAPKCYISQIEALRHVFVQESPWRPGSPLFHYVNDPRHLERVRTPESMVRDQVQYGSTLVDCDDYGCMLAAMALQLGYEVELVALGFEPGVLSHVAVRIKEPKSGAWIFCDGVAAGAEGRAASRAKEIVFKSLD